jgi:hypothetical protein
MTLQEACRFILEALYGKHVLWSAPETFEPGHRVLWCLAMGKPDLVNTIVLDIQEKQRQMEGH